MDEGHTIEELVAAQQEIRFPFWAHDHGFIKAAQGTTQERTVVLSEGPLFLSCFTNTTDQPPTEYAEILGPIEIGPVLVNFLRRETGEDAGGETEASREANDSACEKGNSLYLGRRSERQRRSCAMQRLSVTCRRWTGLVWRILATGLVVALAATACGGSQAKPTEVATLQEPAVTATPKTVFAGSPEPTAVRFAQNAATAVAESGDTTWDMVVLGDSLVDDDYSVLPEAYAALIEEDLGVEVEIENPAVGGESTKSLLTNVQKYPWYREPLQEAEIVLTSVGGGDLPRMEKRFFGGECGGADNQDCLRQQLEESQANWDALLAEISSLADPRETLIRPIIPGVLEYYARVYQDQPEDVEVYNSYVVALYEHMARSCAEWGIPVLDLYALYDGPDADPSLPGLAGTGDGVHVADEGDAVIAGLLRGLGYEFVKP